MSSNKVELQISDHSLTPSGHSLGGRSAEGNSSSHFTVSPLFRSARSFTRLTPGPAKEAGPSLLALVVGPEGMDAVEI